jgi:hypothetical protein
MLPSGCSNQDFGRPVARLADVMDSRKPYVDSREEDMARLRTEQLGKMLLDWEKSMTKTDGDYVLGTDDVIEVGILSMERPDEVAKLSRTVRQDGTISLPLVGDVLPAPGKLVGLDELIESDYLVHSRSPITHPTLWLRSRVSPYEASDPRLTLGARTAKGYFAAKPRFSSIKEIPGPLLADRALAPATDAPMQAAMLEAVIEDENRPLSTL